MCACMWVYMCARACLGACVVVCVRALFKDDVLCFLTLIIYDKSSKLSRAIFFVTN